MDHYEIKNLFSYLEDNVDYLTPLQNEFRTNLKNQYKWTGIITPAQIGQLLTIKEKIPETVSI